MLPFHENQKLYKTDKQFFLQVVPKIEIFRCFGTVKFNAIITVYIYIYIYENGYFQMVQLMHYFSYGYIAYQRRSRDKSDGSPTPERVWQCSRARFHAFLSYKSIENGSKRFLGSLVQYIFHRKNSAITAGFENNYFHIYI